MEDLEVNSFHRALMTTFRREFLIASKMSYLIAIPHSDTLDGQLIDQSFVSAHILVPSKLLKFHYHPLQAGGQNFDHIEMDNRRLICKRVAGSFPTSQQQPGSNQAEKQQLVVRILARELGYSVSNCEYTTILIDQPLVVVDDAAADQRGTGGHQQRPALFRTLLGSLALRSPERRSSRSRQNAGAARLARHYRKPVALSHHNQCAPYLEDISQPLAHELEDQLKRLQSSWPVKPSELDEASQRLKLLADSYGLKFEREAQQQASLQNENEQQQQHNHQLASERHRISVAVESCIVHLMHGKLMVAVREHCEHDDKLLLAKLTRLSRARLDVCQLGAQTHFLHFNASDELVRQLRLLPSLQSPLVMVNGLLKLVDQLNLDLRRSLEFGRLLGAGGGCCSLRDHYEQRAVTVCSDDLIGALVHSLARARPHHFYSLIKYLELFAWNLVSRDQAAYFAATLQVAVQYVMSSQISENAGAHRSAHDSASSESSGANELQQNHAHHIEDQTEICHRPSATDNEDQLFLECEIFSHKTRLLESVQ